MYRVGDRVRVFTDCFSLHTEKGIISNVEFLLDKYEFSYLVALDNGKGGMLVREEDIVELFGERRK